MAFPLFSGAQYYGEGPSYTPTMLEVLKLRQLRMSEEMDPAAASLLPARILPPGSPIPLDVVSPASRPSSPPVAKQQLFQQPPAAVGAGDKLRSRRPLAGKELARLNTFLSEPETKRRTRSAGTGDI